MTGLTKNGIDDAYGDIVVIKTDAMADTMWSFTYGGPLLEGGNSVIQTADGGYMVSGHTEDFGAQDCDAFMMKLDKTGNREWFKIFGGAHDDISEGVIQLADGGYAFAGITASYGNAPGNTETRHVYFVRTNSTGDTSWTRYYAGKGAEYAYSIAAMADGGFLAVGWTTSRGNGEDDGWLLRLKDNGDTLWTKLYQNTGDSRIYKIIPSLDNGFLLCGYTSIGKTSKDQGLVIKLDENGNEQWRKTYGTPTEGYVLHDVAQLPGGNYIFTGTSYKNDSLGNVYILTTDISGNKITDNVYGGSGSYATSIGVQGNNSYLAAGATKQYGDSWGSLYYVEMNNTISGIPGLSEAVPAIFPDPVTYMSSVVLPQAEATQYTHIEVMSIGGKLIYRQDNILAKDIIIYRNTLPQGTYLLRVTCQDGNIYKSRFVVE